MKIKFLTEPTLEIVFERCLTEADEPSGATFQQKSMRAAQEELFQGLAKPRYKIILKKNPSFL
jgi:hypothetical protein